MAASFIPQVFVIISYEAKGKVIHRQRQGDPPVQADYDGDLSYFGFSFGQVGEVPVPGDFDGDGRFDAAVFRPGNAAWFVNRSGGSGVLIAAFGQTSDEPVPGAYVR